MAIDTRIAEAEDCLLGWFHDLDLRRLDTTGGYFTRDGVFRFALSREDAAAGTFIRTEGNEAIADFLKQSFTNLAATHHGISNLRTRLRDGILVSAAHMRVYHQGAGSAAELFEESLSVCEVTYREEDGKIKIQDFCYTMLMILGTTDVFLTLQAED